MEKININLLPVEFLQEKKRRAKKSVYLRISIIVFVLGFIISTAVLLVRLNQSQQLADLENQLASEKTQVSTQSEIEGSAALLKTRLTKISQISTTESIPVQAYNLVTGIMPIGADVINFSMTKENMVKLTVETKNTDILDNLFTSLLDGNSNKGFITGVKLENIHLQEEKISIEMSLDYNPKGGGAQPQAPAT